MNSVTLFLVILVGLLLCSLLLVTLLGLRRVSKLYLTSQETNKEVHLAQIELLSKLSGLLAAKDPMAFQAIQAMDKNFTPEPELEAEETEEEMLARLAQEQYPNGKEEESLDSYERGIINDALRVI